MSYLDALQDELEGCIRNGKPAERIAHIREQIELHGGAAVQRSAATEDKRSAPRGRRAPSKSRGD